MKELYINTPTIKTFLVCAKIELYTAPPCRLVVFTPYGEYYEITDKENQVVSVAFYNLLYNGKATVEDVLVKHRCP